MKTPTITPIPLAAQIAAAEKQASDFRHRRAKLQENLEGLRDQLRAEMHRSLGNSGTSPELKAIRAKITEAEALLDQAEQFIADGDRLVIELHAQAAAARSEEEKATHAAELAHRSSIVKARIAELSVALEAAAKIAGAVAITLGELEQVDKLAATPFFAAARLLNPGDALVKQGFKLGEFIAWGELRWEVFPAVPTVPGLGLHPMVNIPGYLKARDAAAQAAPGVRQ